MNSIIISFNKNNCNIIKSKIYFKKVIIIANNTDTSIDRSKY